MKQVNFLPQYLKKKILKLLYLDEMHNVILIESIEKGSANYPGSKMG